ncbi:MAG: hypothetical protein ACE5KQ_07415 [Thermoplasmata archaeon]
MEQPLRTLFLQDLRSDAEVTFRPRAFYAVFATGFILIFLIESFVLSPNFQALGIRALPNPLYMWIALGLAAALASFKWQRSGAQAD